MESSLRRVLCCIHKRKFIVKESKRGSFGTDKTLFSFASRFSETW